METAVLECKHPHSRERSTSRSEPARSLNKEIDRLETFHFCPPSISSFIYNNKEELARWGFFYVGQPDMVKCYFCKLELANWEPNDEVTHEHRKWSLYCPLMTKRPTNNVPIVANFLDFLEDIVPDVTGTTDERATTSSAATFAIPRSVEPEPEPITVLEDSVPIYNPKYPEYKMEVERLSSFKEWPKSMRQTPAQMVDAGFFYTGKGDIVKCFCCGGALRDWLKDDDPWVEHATYYSGCFYVNLIKSAEFIRECQTNKSKDNSEVKGENDIPKEAEPVAAEPEDDDEKCCKLCYVRPYDTIFMPCRHVVACGKCASATVRCPLCNEPYVNILRIYLP
ncbi:death-associated inhibitor of apoptosis 1-like [Anopheles marshallii]|uniref:death-associated inhibitor of apoptosis 1-like n=1 Tax=Anopheles marshallii TaxID=1521116 RepID=UPI00237AD47F|nr:death-associated inhibitor of apoptosis 1-like [Anopheles marshallii]